MIQKRLLTVVCMVTLMLSAGCAGPSMMAGPSTGGGINEFTETFNGGFDNPGWQGNGTFSSTTYDLAMPPGKSGTNSCYIDSFDTIGGPGSFQLETIWKNIDTNAEGSGWVEWYTKMEMVADTTISDFRIELKLQGAQAMIYCGLQDGTVGMWFERGPVYLESAKRSEFRQYIDFTINGPGDWQVDFSYDIGKGKTPLGSIDETVLSPDSTFDPTAAKYFPRVKYRPRLYIYCSEHFEDFDVWGSLDNLLIRPK